eukprot:3839155-Lingulodinium_polyedra.AAC.1
MQSASTSALRGVKSMLEGKELMEPGARFARGVHYLDGAPAFEKKIVSQVSARCKRQLLMFAIGGKKQTE